MTISNGVLADANDVLNIYHHGGNVHIGKSGTIYVPVLINNATGVRDVYLYMWGKRAGSATVGGSFNHGIGEHSHNLFTSNNDGTTSYTTAVTSAGYVVDEADNTEVTVSVGYTSATAQRNNLVAYDAIPTQVQIWIDGTNKGATIGDPNSRGGTMYTAGSWGVSGTEWSTGSLNITSTITWTAGLHYIELKETGNTAGTLIYHVAVNTGHSPGI